MSDDDRTYLLHVAACLEDATREVIRDGITVDKPEGSIRVRVVDDHAGIWSDTLARQVSARLRSIAVTS